MTAVVGREVSLSLIVGTEETLIAALTSKDMTINNEPVDITSDDDDGWRTLLADTAGTRSVDISCEGVLKSNQVGVLAEGVADIQLAFNIPGIRKYTGTFRITSYAPGAETAEGVTFSAQFQSSGEVEFSAADA